MKTKPDSLLAAGFLLLLIMPCWLLFVSCSDWVMPKILVGTGGLAVMPAELASIRTKFLPKTRMRSAALLR